MRYLMLKLVQELIEANGVVGLQMRQPRPRFRDFAEDFVSDGCAGEDKGAEMNLDLRVLTRQSVMNELAVSLD